MYTIKEVSSMFNLHASTLRYYEDLGLLYDVEKNEQGHRLYNEKHIEWIKLILCLKKANLKISEIKDYVELCRMGKSTIETRLQIIIERRKNILKQISELQEAETILSEKQKYYLSKIKLNEDAINPETRINRNK